jgi:hypothetical protein
MTLPANTVVVYSDNVWTPSLSKVPVLTPRLFRSRRLIHVRRSQTFVR